MNYLILYGSVVIGTIVEPGADPPMGMVHGPFKPAPAYRTVQPIFRSTGSFFGDLRYWDGFDYWAMSDDRD